MGRSLGTLPGMDGQVEVMTDRIIIHRKGILNIFKFGFNARREIPLGAISEIAFKEAGMLQFGQIEFVRAGQSHDDKKKANMSAVKFNKAMQPQFILLKERVFELMNELNRQKK